MNKWIKVEDRQAPPCKDILFTDGKKVYKGWQETYEPFEDVSFYNDQSGMRADHWPEGITHWMHLPELPK